ncbi:glycosyltransferase [Neobacillus niacini]|uniref:glycosyltransferase n=1 Tax=Neobacillus niacini TaxID=86668 RepID=UPI00203FE775|nr:glycosyltransferase [Neobacillus niacini]MCM3693952.1 glycosyltransferase [Neobacillus niacini]
MRILYLSVHDVLEYDELKLFTELGHECFSHGAYARPHLGSSYRHPLHEMPIDPDFVDLVDRYSKYNLHPEMIEDKDVIIVMHDPSIITKNWEKMKHKRVIWRSIGQSSPEVERKLRPYREQGMEIVRYSPRESQIPEYIGEDAMIRFYKDPDEYGGWEGSKNQIMTIGQRMKKNWIGSNYNLFHIACRGLPVKLFGPGNEDAPESGGMLTYAQVKQELRENRTYFYTGTRITSYTLGFIEAFMTGIPIVSVSEFQGNHPLLKQRTFEVHEIIENGKEGFVFDSVLELRDSLNQLLYNEQLAKEISKNARAKAIQIFGKQKIKEQWKEYLSN